MEIEECILNFVHTCSCVALPCCLFDLACFFLPSFSPLIKTYTCLYVIAYTCTCLYVIAYTCTCLYVIAYTCTCLYVIACTCICRAQAILFSVHIAPPHSSLHLFSPSPPPPLPLPSPPPPLPSPQSLRPFGSSLQQSFRRAVLCVSTRFQCLCTGTSRRYMYMFDLACFFLSSFSSLI